MARAILNAGYSRTGFKGTRVPLDHRARKRFKRFTKYLSGKGVEIEDHTFYVRGLALVKRRETTRKMLARAPNVDFLVSL
ncbi:MAG: hypothetical protein GDA36_04305 [Rhodobacteraceae bacterium]|nr:hypothetical protein [Paracoccaceae bacterium]